MGIAAGILGLGAGQGLLWWIGMNLLTSVLIWVRIQTMGFEKNGESKYFKNPVQAATMGMLSNIMTYLLFWIMFYNLVYVI